MGHRHSSSGSSEKQTNQQTVTNTRSTQVAESALWKNQGVQDIIAGLGAEKTTIAPYVYANLNDQQKAALDTMLSGAAVKESEANYAGLAEQAKAPGMNALISQYYNSDLVNQQKADLQSDLADQYNQGVQQLNQQATAAGSMGNSRAGVAQGVMFGKEQTSYAKGVAAINQNAYTTATQLAQNQISNLGTIYQNQRTNAISDVNNRYQAGTVYQSAAQAQADTDWKNKMVQANPYYYRSMMQGGELLRYADLSKTATTESVSDARTGSSSFVSGTPAVAGWQGLVAGGVGAGVGKTVAGFFGGSDETKAAAGATIGGIASSLFS